MLTKESINQAVVRAQYAVRGLLALRAAQLEEELRKNPNAHPFDTIVYCNIGNPQQLAQPPLTFIRQVGQLCFAFLQHIRFWHWSSVRNCKRAYQMHSPLMSSSEPKQSPERWSPSVPIVIQKVKIFKKDKVIEKVSNLFEEMSPHLLIIAMELLAPIMKIFSSLMAPARASPWS